MPHWEGLERMAIEIDHSDFEGTMAAASIGVITGSAEFLDDDDGHGTAVAGIIAAGGAPGDNHEH